MRRLDTAFRWSTFLTLVLASFCLAYTEEAFLPGILTLVLPVGVLLAVAFIIEERWTISLYASNILGLFIAAGAALWIAYQLVQTNSNFVEVAPRSAVLLPYLGPVLMVLMLAIMFRSKQVHDFWWLHTVGLLEVTLACVLASEPFFGVLLFAYLTCALWSLSLYYLHREQRHAERGRPERPLAPAGMFRTSCRWVLSVSLLAGLLFLLVPRAGDAQWDPFTLSNMALSTGYTEGLDLNHSGQVRVSDLVAFEVQAHAADGRPHALGIEQRFRGVVLDMYERGQWSSRALELNLRRQPVLAIRWAAELPDYGPGQYFITFTVDSRRARGLFLADPVLRLVPGVPQLPVISLDEGVWSGDLVQRDLDGALVPVLPPPGKYRYRQVLFPPNEAGLSSPVRLDPSAESQFCYQPIHGIKEWTLELLQRLKEEEKLEDGDFGLVRGGKPIPPEQWPSVAHSDRVDPNEAPWHIVVPRQKWQKMARLLANYLAFSGEFSYSLNLRRNHLNLDPTEDFLRNVKQGHCVRFASALALMLRSCNIPARIVNGFRGVEAKSSNGPDDGRYVVRNRHAHSWVEALVVRERDDGLTLQHWLTLDPTPGEGTPTTAISWFSLGWLDDFFRGTGSLWQNFVLDYNSDRRSETAQAISNSLGRGVRWYALPEPLNKAFADRGSWPGLAGALAVPVVLIAAVWLARSRARRPRHRLRAWRGPVPPQVAPFALDCYEQLLLLIQDHLQLVPRPVQTPRELARAAEIVLRRQPATAAVADVPERIVGFLYRVRYGLVPLTEAESRDADRQLKDLRTLLQPGTPRPAPAS